MSTEASERQTRRFNTAIFIDVENLIGGYGIPIAVIENLSLRDVIASIQASPFVGSIAINRAYANWSDPRLNILRGDIVELGIDPVQMFGFSRGPQRNAADIQLAIDAVDIMHQKPAIDVFVIVSGDGAFSALAKHLHEYGRSVIGCAYRRATNKVFEAVCDAFVWLEPPESPKPRERAVAPASPAADAHLQSVPPQYRPIIQGIPRFDAADRDAAVAVWHALIDRLAHNPRTGQALATGGIGISLLKGLMTAVEPGFDEQDLGFLKFLEFCQYGLRGTPCCATTGPGGANIWKRGSGAIAGYVLPDLSDEDLFAPGVERYRALLKGGSPSLQLPDDPAIVAEICACLADSCTSSIGLAELIDDVASEVDGLETRDQAKGVIYALCFSGLLEREPEGRPLAEQSLRLRNRSTGPDDLLGGLRQVCRQRILAFHRTVDDALLDELVPDAAAPH